MGRKSNIGPTRSGGVDEAKRVPPAKAVARDGQRRVVEAGLEERDGGVDDGVGDVGAVGGQEGGGVEGGVVEVRGRGLAGEEVRGDGEVAGPGEGVGQSDGAMLASFIEISAQHERISASWREKDGENVQSVLRQVDAEYVRQVEHRRVGDGRRGVGLRHVHGDCGALWVSFLCCCVNKRAESEYLDSLPSKTCSVPTDVPSIATMEASPPTGQD